MDDLILLNLIEDLEEAEIVASANIDRRNILDPAQLSNVEFIKLFCVNKDIVTYVVDALQPFIMPSKRMSDIGIQIKDIENSSPDPLLTGMRKSPKKKKSTFSKETLTLLLPARPNHSSKDESNEIKELINIIVLITLLFKSPKSP
ncbi:hypothetical protein FQA39_LY07050 [Lamprigera yunnana]|nr:hypothetical protein FQA39_LY07050 [Lamprigera yunnana]